MRQWLNTELPKTKADVFKKYCRNNGIQYETSEAGDLIHFECFVSDKEALLANTFLDWLID